MKKPEQVTTYKCWHTARLKVQHFSLAYQTVTMRTRTTTMSLYDRQITKSSSKQWRNCKPVSMLPYDDHLFAQMEKYLCLSWHDGLSPPPQAWHSWIHEKFVIESHHHALGTKPFDFDENYSQVCGFEDQQSPVPKATTGWGNQCRAVRMSFPS